MVPACVAWIALLFDTPKSRVFQTFLCPINFAPRGTKKLFEITTKSVGKDMGIIIQGSIRLKTKVWDTIEDDSLVLGGFETRQLAFDLASAISQGSLAQSDTVGRRVHIGLESYQKLNDHKTQSSVIMGTGDKTPGLEDAIRMFSDSMRQKGYKILDSTNLNGMNFETMLFFSISLKDLKYDNMTIEVLLGGMSLIKSSASTDAPQPQLFWRKVYGLESAFYRKEPDHVVRKIADSFGSPDGRKDEDW